jgi:modulator of FtsH protease
MSFQSSYSEPRAVPRETTAIFAQTMFLVAVALAFCVAGTLIGRDLSSGAARACSFGGLAMLLAQGFLGGRIRALRVGAFAIGWLCALALLIGLGLAPFVAYVAEVDPSALTTAIGGTALTVLGMAALGLALSKDLAGWMRPLSYAVFAAVVVSLLGLVFGGLGALNPLLSLLIFGLSALLIMVDFNYLRRHATEDDAVWLATGIFVSIVNIFISLLNLSR